MERALLLALQAAEDGEIPVGAVVVKNNEIIGEGRNRREKKKNPLAHAEIEAIHT
ncbi:MAG: deaminase, partial [Oscillospiraceae bacterium]|nr:deaminase [Oscillospiraceae bacterium]